MRTDLIIDDNTIYEIDMDCMERMGKKDDAAWEKELKKTACCQAGGNRKKNGMLILAVILLWKCFM